MPDLTKYDELNQVRRDVWVANGDLDQAFAQGQARQCLGKDRVYDAAHISFVARWVAAKNCSLCALSGRDNVCLSAGRSGEETGVWGGLYSNDGVKFSVVKPVKQSDIIRALLATIGKSRGADMVRAANRIAPGLKELFLSENGKKMRYATKGQCIIRKARREDLPNGTKGSVREYILTDILAVAMETEQVTAHASCDTPGCIAPWHLRWARSVPTASRAIALGLYASSALGWKITRIAEICGINSKELRQLIALAEILTPVEDLPETVIGHLDQTFFSLTQRHPSPQEMSGLIRICGAAEELDCDSISDLLQSGSAEY